MSEKIWSDDTWADYLYWQSQDKKTLKRINQLLKDIERNGCLAGIGKPEALSNDLQGEFRQKPSRLPHGRRSHFYRTLPWALR